MSSRWTGFIVWALVAASAAFWGLRLFAASRPLPAGASVPARAVASNSPMPRLFGALPPPDAAPAPPPERDRFHLQGVIADGDDGQVIVAVDDQPPKAFHVGQVIEDDTALLRVSRRSAEFGPPGGPTSFTLELPAPASATTGTLPAVPSGGINLSPSTYSPKPQFGNVPPGPENIRGPRPGIPGVNIPGLVNRPRGGPPSMPSRGVPEQPQPVQPLDNEGEPVGGQGAE